MTALYFDCFSGASGDMVLGALIDVGVPLDGIRGALGSLALDPSSVWTTRVARTGITATRFHVRGEEAPESGRSGAWHTTQGDPTDTGEHSHPHPHTSRHARGASATAVAPSHPRGHRTLAEIEALIDASGLSPQGKDRARAMFHRLAGVEADIHGTTLDQVHLHEVGALDSIIDIVGAVFAMESLGVSQVFASPLNVGGGLVRSAHGLYPVPAPATAALLTGVPVYSGEQQVELVTPTGALLMTEYAERFGSLPPMRIQRIGYGAGARDLPDSPNVLRVFLGELDPQAAVHTVAVIEAEIDDMNPQIFGVLMERLLNEGALDVYYTPIQMKKNRPGTLLTVVAAPSTRERLSATIFAESTTIGLRFCEMQRECLDRETVTIDTPLGPVRMKVARRDGRVVNTAPEFDDCMRLAAEHGRPVKEIQALALKVFLDR